MPIPRPSFSIMLTQFTLIYGNGTVESVGKKIGGKVQQNIELGVKDPMLGFTNACAIRMSYSRIIQTFLLPGAPGKQYQAQIESGTYIAFLISLNFWNIVSGCQTKP